jgi:acetyl esterase/lipase
MRSLVITLGIAVAFHALDAQASPWHPSPGHTQMAIWPGLPPGGHAVPDSESIGTAPKPVAGKPWVYVRNVSRPTLTVYSPQGQNTGAAIIVFPGGGYQILAIDLEGTEVCDWLRSRGITCILLKYRVPNAGALWNQLCGCFLNTKSSLALEDAQRTLGLVRLHAAEWRIDPHKVGVLGFSAGGHLVAAVSTHFEQRVYPVVDAADQESCRPDFAVALYPGHLLIDYEKLELNPNIRVTRNTPPTFLAQAENDDVDNVNNSLVYYAALKKAGVSVEMHLFPEGGHSFGLRPTKDPITEWPQLVEKWLRTIGII